MSISVVIPALNLRKCLDLTFRSLEAQTDPQFECLLVDDGSSDGTLEWLATRPTKLQLKVLRNEFPNGRSAARNAGWLSSAGDTVVFLDGDMLPVPGWIASYRKALRTGAHVISGARYCLPISPHLADLTGRLCHLAGASREALLRQDPDKHFARLKKLACPGAYPTPLFAQLERDLRTVCLDYPSSTARGYSLITSNVAVQKTVLQESGGFCAFVRR
jgi:glycosyltransferase involved in cell wall biosynthesis